MVRLREIKPGMVIECKTDEELKILLEEAERLGYLWSSGKPPTKEINAGMTIHFYDASEYVNHKYITWSDRGSDIKFSDLIIPELSAEEVLRITTEICHKYSNLAHDCKDECPFCHSTFCKDWMVSNMDSVIAICKQWKADHEKKEPEFEWVDICRIIEIQSNGFKKCVHELDLAIEGTKEDKTLKYWLKRSAENELKRYISSHDGNYIAVVERVCRVKK